MTDELDRQAIEYLAEHGAEEGCGIRYDPADVEAAKKLNESQTQE